jgi:cytochrome c oxidase cbb3-type subunit 1
MRWGTSFRILRVGTSAGAVGGLFIHDLVGLFVTPLGWGMMYYFVPILLKKPIWSHGLSLVGFWGLAFFYPLQGIHHFLYTPIPMFLQYGAVVSTIAVELVVTTVIINFFGTLGELPALSGRICRSVGSTRAWSTTS